MRGCPEGLAVTDKDGCEEARRFFGIATVVLDKQLASAPYGCYFYEDERKQEVHFNGQKPGAFSADSNPICREPGTTPPTTRPSRVNQECKNENFVGDKYCDSGNNNAGCNWDKKDEEGAISDCCQLPTGEGMGDCKDADLCKCLDPDYVPPPTTTTLEPPPTTPTTKPATVPTTTKLPTTPATVPTTTVKAVVETTVVEATAAGAGADTTGRSIASTSAPRPNIWWTASLCVALGFALVRGL